MTACCNLGEFQDILASKLQCEGVLVCHDAALNMTESSPSSCVVQVTSLEGAVFSATLSAKGVDFSSDLNSVKELAAYDSLHSLLMAKSPLYTKWYFTTAVERALAARRDMEENDSSCEES